MDYWLSGTREILEAAGEKGMTQALYLSRLKSLPVISKNPVISDTLLDFLESHLPGARDGHLDGIPFNAAYDDPAPLGVDSKLSALDIPGERDFFVAYFPGPSPLGLSSTRVSTCLGKSFSTAL